jgi:hypothetical protein
MFSKPDRYQMLVETLGEAFAAGWRVHMSCAGGKD